MARVLAQVAMYLEQKKEEMGSEKFSWQLADKSVSISCLRQEMERLMLVMGKLVSIHYCKKISSAVGVSDNELAYEKAFESLEPSVALKLVDITIQMEHSRGFPEANVLALLKELKGNPFAIGVLQFLIALHFLVYNVDPSTRKRVAKAAGMDANQLEPNSLRLSNGD